MNNRPKFLAEINDLLHVHSNSIETVNLQHGTSQDPNGRKDSMLMLNRADAEKLRQALTAWLSTGDDEATDEQKMLVMVGEGLVPTVILGMPAAAWEYCKDGKAHTFDFTPLGLGCHVLVAGGATHERIIADVQAGAAHHGLSIEGEEKLADLGIKSPRPN